jgi:hypothetical protein
MTRRTRGLHRIIGLSVRLAVVAATFIGLAPTAGFAQAAGSTPSPWYERIQFGGDFRARYEGFYKDETTTRHRGRMRLRLRIDTDVNDDTHLQIQIASGDDGTPVSTNQTLTGFFRPKPLNLDRANIAYNPAGASALTLGAGKFGFPLTRTQMTWDDDLNWEGAYEQVAWSAGDRVDIQLVAVQTTVNEVSRDANSQMFAGYGEIGVAFGDHAFQLSVADYGFTNVDQVAVGRAFGPLRSLLTNEVTLGGDGEIVGLVSDFNLVDVIAEVELDTGRDGYPFRVLVDVVRNTKAVSDLDTGLWFEAEYGGSRVPGSYTMGYTYGRIEQDAVLSPFMFSDVPGSNLQLHMVNLAYVPLSNLTLDLTLHFTKQLEVDPGANNAWLTRPHLAAIVRF